MNSTVPNIVVWAISHGQRSVEGFLTNRHFNTNSATIELSTYSHYIPHLLCTQERTSSQLLSIARKKRTPQAMWRKNSQKQHFSFGQAHCTTDFGEILHEPSSDTCTSIYAGDFWISKFYILYDIFRKHMSGKKWPNMKKSSSVNFFCFSSKIKKKIFKLKARL